MPDIICDTSAIQYLYQLELLHILPKLADRVLVPPAVMDEIEVGRAADVPLPDLADLDWVIVQRPVSVAAVPLLTDLGPGEAEVLMLAIETMSQVELRYVNVPMALADAVKQSNIQNDSVISVARARNNLEARDK